MRRPTSPPRDPTALARPAGEARVILLSVVVLIIGGIASAIIISTAPGVEQENELRPPKLVKTIEVAPSDETIHVRAYGTVIPARQVTVAPEVGGRVVRQHESLEPGGRIDAGEEILAIDDSDYRLAVDAARATLQEAQFELDVERGRQVVARREWRLLEEDVPQEDTNRSLVLREPHLRRAEALVKRAENSIADAELDLARTSVTAPFNSLVLQESVELGQLLERGASVATLVGADEFWVRVSVPSDMLRWIEWPRDDTPGSKAQVIQDSGAGREVAREGRVLRLLGDVEPSGRMARLLVSIPDPLGLRDRESQRPPLLLGSYVEVAIEAGVLRDVVSIRRSALREGHRLWLVGDDAKLRVRDVEVLWSRKDSVLVPKEAIRPGERLIVSGLRVALPGMSVEPRPEQEPEQAPETSSVEGGDVGDAAP